MSKLLPLCGSFKAVPGPFRRKPLPWIILAAVGIILAGLSLAGVIDYLHAR